MGKDEGGTDPGDAGITIWLCSHRACPLPCPDNHSVGKMTQANSSPGSATSLLCTLSQVPASLWSSAPHLFNGKSGL